MIPEDKVKLLVETHVNLDDKMTGAIWIRRSDPMVWLVEVIPSLGDDDDQADEPTYFNAGMTFRFPLALVAGSRESLERALKKNPILAHDVADGLVMYDKNDADALVALAKQLQAA